MYRFKTIILGTDLDKLTSVGEHLKNEFHDEIFMTVIRMEFEEYLANHQPDIFLIDMSSKLSDSEKNNIAESVNIIAEKYSDCVIMAYGDKKSSLKDKDFQETVDCFSGKTIAKISQDYGQLRSNVIVKGNKMISVLAGFFAPYLVGNFDQPGFDILLTEAYERDEDAGLLDELKKGFGLFSSLLQEENRNLIESALDVYEERLLTAEEIESIQNSFFFQFTSLTAMENFIDRRRYYAEKGVIEEVWESTISFAREIENSVIFGCHKLGDEVNLKITIPVEHDLKKISERSKFYKTIKKIEPYGTMSIRSGSQTISIGSDHHIDKEEFVEGTVFNIQIKVFVPTRRRRGLKRV